MVFSVPTVCYKYGGVLTWWWCSEDSLFQGSQVKVWRPGNQYSWLSKGERGWHTCERPDSTWHCPTRGDPSALGLLNYKWKEEAVFIITHLHCDTVTSRNDQDTAAFSESPPEFHQTGHHYPNICCTLQLPLLSSSTPRTHTLHHPLKVLFCIKSPRHWWIWKPFFGRVSRWIFYTLVSHV